MKDCLTANCTIQACIVAHTFASWYDTPDDIMDLLSGSELLDDVINQIAQSSQLSVDEVEGLRASQHANQQQFEAATAASTQGMSSTALSQHQSSLAHNLREDLFQALFWSAGWPIEDTSAISWHHERMRQ